MSFGNQGINDGFDNSVPELKPNTIKSMMLSETIYGTSTHLNGTVDVMQANVKDDWDKNKLKVGIKSPGVTEDYHLSISAGILWLYLKGVKVSDIKFSSGWKLCYPLTP